LRRGIGGGCFGGAVRICFVGCLEYLSTAFAREDDLAIAPKQEVEFVQRKRIARNNDANRLQITLEFLEIRIME